AAFNDDVKTNVLAGKMVGRFTPPNPFNNSAEIAVAIPALFIAWL
ncbi:17202_t:CDS:1, partial [Funneliformis geosporum]